MNCQPGLWYDTLQDACDRPHNVKCHGMCMFYLMFSESSTLSIYNNLLEKINKVLKNQSFITDHKVWNEHQIFLNKGIILC